MFKTSANESLRFSSSEIKATVNSVIIPLILMLLSKNLLMGLCWIFLVTIIYTFVQKEKTENAKMFFHFLKIMTLIFIGIISIVFLMVL